jgi:XTP/dITP diphosphohydrolase
MPPDEVTASESLDADETTAADEVIGSRLLHAVRVMDRLRSPGGCPWDAQQTHESLRQYLVEETYELLDAIEHGDRTVLREELGDVLLQVLFHARIAAEHPTAPFDIDDVAGTLADKLVGRHPHVFAGTERLSTAAEQEHRWEQLKREEKRRNSAVDGVAFGQPAAALAAKLVSRTARAGLPPDLLPGFSSFYVQPQPPPDQAGTPANVTTHTPAHPSPAANGPRTPPESAGDELFALVARLKLAGHDPEAELRAAAKRFAAQVRAAESSARAAGEDPTTLTPEAWRTHFPADPEQTPT